MTTWKHASPGFDRRRSRIPVELTLRKMQSLFQEGYLGLKVMTLKSFRRPKQRRLFRPFPNKTFLHFKVIKFRHDKSKHEKDLWSVIKCLYNAPFCPSDCNRLCGVVLPGNCLSKVPRTPYLCQFDTVNVCGLTRSIFTTELKLRTTKNNFVSKTRYWMLSVFKSSLEYVFLCKVTFCCAVRHSVKLWMVLTNFVLHPWANVYEHFIWLLVYSFVPEWKHLNYIEIRIENLITGLWCGHVEAYELRHVLC